jgi:hypothetical protein
MINYMGKIHTIIVRGVTKAQKNSLKRQAKLKDKRASVNNFMLQLIYDKTIHDIESFEINKKDK